MRILTQAKAIGPADVAVQAKYRIGRTTATHFAAKAASPPAR
jgi:hypothetical protein